MGRGADNLCLRNSMPVLPVMHPAASTSNHHIDTGVEPAPDTMTWQQQEAFGASVVSEST